MNYKNILEECNSIEKKLEFEPKLIAGSDSISEKAKAKIIKILDDVKITKTLIKQTNKK